MKIITLPFFLFLFICFLPFVEATDYFVSTIGNNANTGLLMDQAWGDVKFGSDQLHAGDTLYIGGGTYYDDEISIPRSGTSNGWITIQNYNNEYVLLQHEKKFNSDKGINCLARKSYIKIENIHFSHFNTVGYISGKYEGNTHHLILENTDSYKSYSRAYACNAGAHDIYFGNISISDVHHPTSSPNAFDFLTSPHDRYYNPHSNYMIYNITCYNVDIDDVDNHNGFNFGQGTSTVDGEWTSHWKTQLCNNFHFDGCDVKNAAGVGYYTNKYVLYNSIIENCVIDNCFNNLGLTGNNLIISNVISHDATNNALYFLWDTKSYDVVIEDFYGYDCGKNCPYTKDVVRLTTLNVNCDGTIPDHIPEPMPEPIQEPIPEFTYSPKPTIVPIQTPNQNDNPLRIQHLIFDILGINTSDVWDHNWDKLSMSKLNPDKNISSTNNMEAWVDIVGFDKLYKKNNIYYYPGDPLNDTVVEYKVTDYLTGSNSRFNDNVDWINQDVSFNISNKTITVTMNITMLWHESTKRKNRPGIKKTYHYDYLTVTDTEILPEVHINRSLKDGGHIKICNNSFNPKMWIVLNIDGRIKTDVIYRNEIVEYYNNVPLVEYTSKGYPYVNLTGVASDSPNDNELLKRVGPYYCITGDSFDIFNITVYTRNIYDSHEIRNFTVDYEEYDAKHSFSPVFMLFNGILLIFIGGIYYIRRQFK